jgi:hypothetical protein
VLPRKFFSFELVQQLVHPVRIDTGLKAVDEGANLERRGFHRFLGHAQTNSQSLIHRDLETLPAASNCTVEPFGYIRIESKGSAHGDILMLRTNDVKMPRLAIS